MNGITAEEIRGLLLEMYAGQLAQRGITPPDIGDEYDLLREGIIDSLGILEMLLNLEERFGGPLQLAGLDPEKIAQIGPISEYLEEQLRGR
jgi:acyl carrier protein